MKKTFHIDGMHCASCAVRIEGLLTDQKDVDSAVVNYALAKATVEGRLPLAEIETIIKKEGYTVRTGEGSNEKEDPAQMEMSKALKKAAIASALALPVFVLAMFRIELPEELFNIGLSAWIEGIVTTIIVLGPGLTFHRAAFTQLKRFTASMDTLISMGTLVALIFSWWSMLQGGDRYFETAAVITALILVGRYMEARSKGRASQAISRLLELGAKTAHRLKKDGTTEEVPVSDLVVGDLVLVKAGEKIPLDGIVKKGESHVDESMLTGESELVKKAVDAQVFGATLNQQGVMTVEVTVLSEKSVLAQIITLVENAQQQKAPVQKLADKISSVFVPIVIGIALLTLLVWWFVTGDIEGALLPAVAVLVIACPCALGLATPTAILVGTGSAAKQGILIKSGEALQRGHSVQKVLFDKTGTITQGRPIVTDLEGVGMGEAQVLEVVAALEHASEHPLAQAVMLHAKKKKVKIGEAKQFKVVRGQGVTGSVGGVNYTLGSAKFIAESVAISDELNTRIQTLQAEAKTVIVLASKQVDGILAIADAVKEGAVEAVKMLHDRGIKVAMVTGDHQKTAEAIAKVVGIEEIFAGVMPDQKLAIVTDEQKNGAVAFVGDGINDAPALTQADLGIAMGEGTDIAIEAGQVVIVGGDVRKVARALTMSSRTYKTIKQNLFWAFIYNAVGIPLAAIGLLNPMIAAGAMAFSSISVLLNSLRLKRM
jgi:P-type Cu+ transporter